MPESTIDQRLDAVSDVLNPIHDKAVSLMKLCKRKAESIYCLSGPKSFTDSFFSELAEILDDMVMELDFASEALEVLKSRVEHEAGK